MKNIFRLADSAFPQLCCLEIFSANKPYIDSVTPVKARGSSRLNYASPCRMQTPGE